MKLITRTDHRDRRHLRLRHKVKGDAERPRMAVFLSNRHIYVQFIDDDASTTLAAASTQSEGMEGAKGKATVGVAKQLGKLAAEKAKGKGIAKVVFDRGGFSYRGRIKALADAAREAGLQF